MFKDTILDQSRKYRYVLKRQWGADDNNFVNFVLLNPSTADETKDDRTITTCIKLAQNLGYDGLWVTNLFAFRATEPTDLKKSAEPIGKLNNQYLKDCAERSKIVVIAWGNHGDFLNRDQEVIKLLSKIQAPHCLEITKLGNPKHPLYIKRTAKTFCLDGATNPTTRTRRFALQIKLHMKNLFNKYLSDVLILFGLCLFTYTLYFDFPFRNNMFGEYNYNYKDEIKFLSIIMVIFGTYVFFKRHKK